MKKQEESNKDTLSGNDLQKGIKTFEEHKHPHKALQTPEGKNNGAEPKVFRNTRKAHT